MNRNEFDNLLHDFKSNLEERYLSELQNENFTLNDYGKFSLMFVSKKTGETINQLFISKFSQYKIGDKFQKVETIFYKTKEEFVKSKVWKIYDISIFHNRENDGYHFTYYCVDANAPKFEQFPQKKSFDNLKAVDYTSAKGLRTKYYFIKID